MDDLAMEKQVTRPSTGLMQSLKAAAICSLLCAASLCASESDSGKTGDGHEKPAPVAPVDPSVKPSKDTTPVPPAVPAIPDASNLENSGNNPKSAPATPVKAAPEIPFVIRQPGDPAHWYDKLVVILDEKPAPGELANVLAPRKAEVEHATEAMIAGINKAVTEKGTLGDKWSIISLTCTKRGTDLMLTAHVGLAKLYTKVPSIAFNATLLDHCVGKLARDSGIQVAQSTQAYNPRVTFNKNNISPAEALESILPAHGFRYRYSGVIESTNVRVQDFLTEAELIDAMNLSIASKIKVLSVERPGILVAPKGSNDAPAKAAAPVPAPKPTSAAASPATPATKPADQGPPAPATTTPAKK